MLVNTLSVSLLGIKNEDYLLEARKTLVRAIKYLEDTVSNYIDVPFSDYEAKLEEIKDFDAEGRFRLLRKLGFAVQSLEEAFGENSKYSASFIEVWGKVATVGKNLVNLKTAVPDMDFSSPVAGHRDEPPRPREAAPPAQRGQIPRAVRALYAQGPGLPRGGHLPSGPPADPLVLSERDEAETLKRKVEIWSTKLEADLKKAEEAKRSRNRELPTERKTRRNRRYRNGVQRSVSARRCEGSVISQSP